MRLLRLVACAQACSNRIRIVRGLRRLGFGRGTRCWGWRQLACALQTAEVGQASTFSDSRAWICCLCVAKEYAYLQRGSWQLQSWIQKSSRSVQRSVLSIPRYVVGVHRSRRRFGDEGDQEAIQSTLLARRLRRTLRSSKSIRLMTLNQHLLVFRWSGLGTYSLGG